MCFQAAMGTQGAVIVLLAGVAALTALLRRKTGMGIGAAILIGGGVVALVLGLRKG